MSESSEHSSACSLWSGIKHPASNTASSGKGEERTMFKQDTIQSEVWANAKTHYVEGCKGCGISYYFSYMHFLSWTSQYNSVLSFKEEKTLRFHCLPFADICSFYSKLLQWNTWEQTEQNLELLRLLCIVCQNIFVTFLNSLPLGAMVKSYICEGKRCKRIVVPAFTFNDRTLFS